MSRLTRFLTPLQEPRRPAENWRILDPVCRENRRAWRWRRIGKRLLNALCVLAIAAVLAGFAVVIISGAGNV